MDVFYILFVLGFIAFIGYIIIRQNISKEPMHVSPTRINRESTKKIAAKRESTYIPYYSHHPVIRTPKKEKTVRLDRIFTKFHRTKYRRNPLEFLKEIGLPVVSKRRFLQDLSGFFFAGDLGIKIDGQIIDDATIIAPCLLSLPKKGFFEKFELYFIEKSRFRRSCLTAA